MGEFFFHGEKKGAQTGWGFVGDEMGVSKNRGTPKWMVYNGKPYKMDDLGVALFSETSKYYPVM